MNVLQQSAPYIGYFASLLLVLSLAVSNSLRFRLFNSLGSIVFIVYGAIIGAIPVILTNGILLCINCYYLTRIYRKTGKFDTIEFKGDEILVQKFLEFHEKKINDQFPGFDPARLPYNLNFLITRDTVIVCIFSAKTSPDNNAEVLINYFTPEFHDQRLGGYIYQEEKNFLKSKGVKKITYETVAGKADKKFLRCLGFESEGIMVFKNL